MKILIAPLIDSSKADSAWLMCRRMAELFSKRGHAVAVSTDLNSSFSGAALYDCAPLKKPVLKTGSRLAYEEWLYDKGAASYEYLKADTECMLKAIAHFRPDLIIVINRIAAASAARTCGIPSIAVIHTAMYRNNSFPIKALQPANRLLSDYDQEQVFRASSVYDACTARVAFGPIQAQSFPEETDVQRFGIAAQLPEISDYSGGIFVCFNDMHRKSSYLKKIVLESFRGAPYPVNAWIRDIPAEKKDNIQFLSSLREDLAANASVCIHDGNDYIYNLCAASAVPQLIISSHEYGRISNALAARRFGYGNCLDESDLSVASLYEGYRQIVCDPKYIEDAQAIRNEIISLGGMEDFYRFICTEFRNSI